MKMHTLVSHKVCCSNEALSSKIMTFQTGWVKLVVKIMLSSYHSGAVFSKIQLSSHNRTVACSTYDCL